MIEPFQREKIIQAIKCAFVAKNKNINNKILNSLVNEIEEILIKENLQNIEVEKYKT